MGVFIFGTGGSGGGGIDLSNDTVAPQQVRNPYTFHDAEGNAQTGEIYNWDGTILSGSSSDANKMTVDAGTGTRYIKAGSYLGRDIELKAMPAGSATMSRSNNVITLTKEAGYIAGGTATETIPTFTGTTVTPSASQQTISLVGKYATGNVVVNGDINLVADNIKSGASIFGVAGTYTGSSYTNYTGATTVTPSSIQQTLYTAGKVVPANIVVYGDANLKGSNIRSGASIFGVAGTYTGAASQSVYFSGATGTSMSGTSVTINGSSTMQMVSFISNSTTSGVIVSVMAWRGGSVFYYVNGVGRGNTATATWSDNKVTFSFANSGYSLSGSYRVVYAYLA